MKNWKLKEIKGRFTVVDNNSLSYRDKLLKELNIPINYEENIGLFKSDTIIEWDKMPQYYTFFLIKKIGKKEYDNG